MTRQTVLDHFNSGADFEEMLNEAEARAQSPVAYAFISQLRERYHQFKEGMFLSDDQYTFLAALAGEE